MSFNFDYFIECLISGISYLPNTIKLVTIPLSVGLILGTIIALIRIFNVPVIGKILGIFVALYQGIPIVVALMIYNLVFTLKFNDVAQFFRLNVTVAEVDNIWVGIIALSLMDTTMITESIRGAFMSVDRGQYEAGYAVGLTKIQTLCRIIIPQMIPVAIPLLTNNIVGTIKGSSVVMAIGITEVLAGSVIPCSKTYSFLEGYIAAAVIYWLFTIAVEKIAKLVERKSNKYRGVLT
jgi:L-cystine transport system permease protein